jgi:hypothetical protein
VITCPFCSCSCCRWQHSSARRAVSNNPPPRIRPGLFLCLIAAGHPRSPQEPPSAPGACIPVRMYARHPLRPSCAVLARRGHACTIQTTPAEYAPPLTMPLQGVMSGFYIPHTSGRVNAFSRVLRPPNAPCNAVRVVPSRGMRGHLVKDPPGGRKGTRPEAGHISAAFPSGFSIRFFSSFFRLAITLYASHSRWHSRLYSRLIVAYSLTSSPVVSMVPSPSTSR